VARIDQGQGNETNLIGEGFAARGEDAYSVPGLGQQARVLSKDTFDAAYNRRRSIVNERDVQRTPPFTCEVSPV
jgi:hypothetical protein